MPLESLDNWGAQYRTGYTAPGRSTGFEPLKPLKLYGQEDDEVDVTPYMPTKPMVDQKVAEQQGNEPNAFFQLLQIPERLLGAQSIRAAMAGDMKNAFMNNPFFQILDAFIPGDAIGKDYSFVDVRKAWGHKDPDEGGWNFAINLMGEIGTDPLGLLLTPFGKTAAALKGGAGLAAKIAAMTTEEAVVKGHRAWLAFNLPFSSKGFSFKAPMNLDVHAARAMDAVGDLMNKTALGGALLRTFTAIGNVPGDVAQRKFVKDAIDEGERDAAAAWLEHTFMPHAEKILSQKQLKGVMKDPQTALAAMALAELGVKKGDDMASMKNLIAGGVVRARARYASTRLMDTDKEAQDLVQQMLDAVDLAQPVGLKRVVDAWYKKYPGAAIPDVVTAHTKELAEAGVELRKGIDIMDLERGGVIYYGDRAQANLDKVVNPTGLDPDDVVTAKRRAISEEMTPEQEAIKKSGTFLNDVLERVNNGQVEGVTIAQLQKAASAFRGLSEQIGMQDKMSGLITTLIEPAIPRVMNPKIKELIDAQSYTFLKGRKISEMSMIEWINYAMENGSSATNYRTVKAVAEEYGSQSDTVWEVMRNVFPEKFVAKLRSLGGDGIAAADFFSTNPAFSIYKRIHRSVFERRFQAMERHLLEADNPIITYETTLAGLNDEKDMAKVQGLIKDGYRMLLVSGEEGARAKVLDPAEMMDARLNVNMRGHRILFVQRATHAAQDRIRAIGTDAGIEIQKMVKENNHSIADYDAWKTNAHFVESELGRNLLSQRELDEQIQMVRDTAAAERITGAQTADDVVNRTEKYWQMVHDFQVYDRTYGALVAKQRRLERKLDALRGEAADVREAKDLLKEKGDQTPVYSQEEGPPPYTRKTTSKDPQLAEPVLQAEAHDRGTKALRLQRQLDAVNKELAGKKAVLSKRPTFKGDTAQGLPDTAQALLGPDHPLVKAMRAESQALRRLTRLLTAKEQAAGVVMQGTQKAPSDATDPMLKAIDAALGGPATGKGAALAEDTVNRLKKLRQIRRNILLEERVTRTPETFDPEALEDILDDPEVMGALERQTLVATEDLPTFQAGRNLYRIRNSISKLRSRIKTKARAETGDMIKPLLTGNPATQRRLDELDVMRKALTDKEALIRASNTDALTDMAKRHANWQARVRGRLEKNTLRLLNRSTAIDHKKLNEEFLYYSRMQEEGVAPIDELQRDFPQLFDNLKKTAPNGRVVFVDNQIFERVWGAEGILREMKRPDSFRNALGWMDGMTKWWKTFTAVLPFPGSRFRDWISGMVMGFHGGMNPKHLMPAATLATEITRAVGRDLDISSLEGMMLRRFLPDGTEEITNANELVQAAFQYRNLNNALIMDELGLTFAQAEKKISRGTSKNFLSADPEKNPIVKLGIDINERLDNHARLTQIIAHWMDGKSMDEANRVVRQWSYNPARADLSHAERYALRRFLPFYSWLKASVKMSVDSWFSRPGAMALYQKVHETAKDHTGLEADEFDAVAPDYIEDNFGIPYSIDDKGLKFFMFGGFLPIGDTNKLVNALSNIVTADNDGTILDFIGERLNPLIKTPLEQVMKRSFYNQKEFKQYAGQKVEFMGLSMAPETKNLMMNIRLLNEVDNLNILNFSDVSKLLKWEGAVNRPQQAQTNIFERVALSSLGTGLKAATVGTEAQLTKEEAKIKMQLARDKGMLKKVVERKDEVTGEDNLQALQEAITADMAKQNALLRAKDKLTLTNIFRR